jgi:hypothetical protein
MRSYRLVAITAVILAIAACAKPPQAEIDAAKAAVNTASKNPDVVTYAPDSLRDAQEKMAALDEEIAAQARKSALSRKYDAAKDIAVTTIAAAARASKDAEIAKDQVAKEAAALAEKLEAAIPAFESKAYAARRVKGIKLDFAALALTSDQARAALGDARKDLAARSFAAAKAKLMAAQDRLSAEEENITEQARIAKNR